MLRNIIYTILISVIYCDEYLRSSDCDIKHVIKGTQKVKVADCSDRGLTFIPQTLPGDITVLDQRSNLLTRIENNSFVNYKTLSFLAIDMMPRPHFGIGFSRISNLKELHFESCYLVILSNKTLQTCSTSIEELTLRNCRLHFGIKEEFALLPFPRLRNIDFSGTFMHLKPVLQLLWPFSNVNITTINFGQLMTSV
ncbi:unnamed protein product [Mytilus coruscus]|uniref:Uncharacterized protein n=1 Tax=Mytilus coruscus TaxID=42192 RepID=A0A6J8E236_MYTCO|nr:unnamed protein product [Mytilus coruscus]